MEKERERERKREKEREKGRRRKTGTLMEKAVEFNREREGPLMEKAKRSIVLSFPLESMTKLFCCE